MTKMDTGWRKSSYSAANNDCVEVIGSLDRIRDSKNPAGPVLAVELASLLTAIKAGDLAS